MSIAAELADRRLEARDRGLQNLEPREVFVVALDDRPGRQPSAGALNHFVDRLLVCRPFCPVSPVFVGQLPSLVLCLLALLEAAQLLVLGDVDPVLDYDDAAVDELFLELVDLGVGAAPFFFGRKAFDPLNENASVPAAVEDRDLPGARQVPPEAPEVMLRPLLVGGRGDRDDLIRARVERSASRA